MKKILFNESTGGRSGRDNKGGTNPMRGDSGQNRKKKGKHGGPCNGGIWEGCKSNGSQSPPQKGSLLGGGKKKSCRSIVRGGRRIMTRLVKKTVERKGDVPKN